MNGKHNTTSDKTYLIQNQRMYLKKIQTSSNEKMMKPMTSYNNATIMDFTHQNTTLNLKGQTGKHIG